MPLPVAPFVLAILPLVFAAFRRIAPRNLAAEAVRDDGRRLPSGAVTAAMWGLALVIAAGGFGLLYAANHLWAALDHDATLTLYPTVLFWCFLPGFAAVCIPWLSVIWLMRRNGYAAQAAEVIAKGNAKMGADGERVMRWLAWGTVIPIAAVTLPALPMHLSLEPGIVRVTHYAHITPEVFRLADARHTWTVEGYTLKDGSFQAQPDFLVDFADGRRLAATVMSDGGDPPPQQFVSDLLTQTRLLPTRVHTAADIPATH